MILAFPIPPGAEHFGWRELGVDLRVRLPVCAGLPCARLGFKFLLQANWQLTTSREAVRESVENYQLRSDAARLLALAVQHPEVLPHLAVFLPTAGAERVMV